MAIIKRAENGFVLDAGDTFWIAHDLEELKLVVQQWYKRNFLDISKEETIEEIQKAVEEAGGKPPSPFPPGYKNKFDSQTGGTELPNRPGIDRIRGSKTD